MQEAGLMNFLRTILIILLIYYGLKLIGRLVFPIFIKKMMQNVEQRYGQQRRQQEPPKPHFKEGETVIDKAPKQVKSNDNVGEYVDYEDLE